MTRTLFQVRTTDALDKLKGLLSTAPAVSLDLETAGADGTKETALDPLRNTVEWALFGVRDEDGDRAYAVRLDRFAPDEEGVLVGLVAAALENGDAFVVGQNLKFDFKTCMVRYSRTGRPFRVEAQVADVMIASQLLDENRKRHGLEHLVEDFLGEKRVPYDEAVKDRGSWRTYMYNDVMDPLRLWAQFEPRLEEEGLWKLFTEIEMPYLEVLALMELYGIRLDMKATEKMEATLEGEIAKEERAIYKLAGHGFNIGSPQQLGKVLFDELGLPPPEKTKTGQWKTGKNVLYHRMTAHKIVPYILRQRETSKLNSGFARPLQAHAAKVDGRVRTTFGQCDPVTGRLNSKEPNMQNIPIRTDLGRLIRGLFRASRGWLFVVADYSQLELRVLGHQSQDVNLLRAYTEGLDLHAMTAEGAGCDRDQGKTINFRLAYIGGVWGLWEQLNIERIKAGFPPDIPLDDAREYRSAWFDLYPGVLRYYRKIQATLDGKNPAWVKTITGRRRRFPEWHYWRQQEREGSRKDREDAAKRVARMHRQAVNAPIQGSSADILKLAQRDVYRAMVERGLAGRARQIIQVHDEIVTEVRAEIADDAAQIIKDAMEAVVPLRVPLTVDIGVGPTWADAK